MKQSHLWLPLPDANISIKRRRLLRLEVDIPARATFSAGALIYLCSVGDWITRRGPGQRESKRPGWENSRVVRGQGNGILERRARAREVYRRTKAIRMRTAGEQ
jgi:hypothetical protein